MFIDLSRRFGFVAKGLVYLLVGFLAAKAALMRSGGVNDEEGALRQVLAAPFGKVLLAVAAAGLFIYALGRLIEMWKDPEEKGKIWRFESLLSAFVYGGLGVEALRMVLGMQSGGGGESESKEQVAFLISLPFGHWLTIVIALIAIAMGLQELYRALARRFEDRQAIKGVSDSVKPWLLRLGRFGILSRAVVSLLVAAYLLLAGIHRAPSEARGTKGAIESIRQYPFGVWLLAVIAIGLTAYGVYTLVEARYRKLAS
ncbi:MAG TPA: DUF1206 domain-containing protein [Thermoanaerobaculia bacterium]|nr:DUF1206 domain-containing protein [Thermoanaerobaculia bacterium]